MANKVFLVGRLGSDPEIDHTPGGKAIAKFSLATSEKYKGREITQWHKIVAWEKMADLCKKYLKKGHQLLVEGKIVYNTWEKAGQKHTTAEIWMDKMEFLGPRNQPEAPPEEVPFKF